MRQTSNQQATGLAVAAPSAVLHALVLGMRAFWRAVVQRLEIGKLSEMDDRQLLDIGLRREDVREALTSSFFSDPGAHLTDAARSRINAYYRDLR